MLNTINNGIYISFSPDNAAMESFFSTMKTERLSRKHYRTEDDLLADVFMLLGEGHELH